MPIPIIGDPDNQRPERWNSTVHTIAKPIPVAMRSKAWVCGLLLAGIAGSNAAGGMSVCFLWILCVRYRSLRLADHSSRGFLPSGVCLSVIVNPGHWGGPGPLGAFAPLEEKGLHGVLGVP
jgi:hypothetical protein